MTPIRDDSTRQQEAKTRRGEVVERIFDGRAVRHFPEGERFHCLAYPCPNLTVWFYMPAWSHLCMECMVGREATR